MEFDLTLEQRQFDDSLRAKLVPWLVSYAVGALLGVGLTLMIVMQALFNMSVVTGLLPNKGMPLPFVSNGGSSLLVNLFAMGVLLNISQQASTVAAARMGVAHVVAVSSCTTGLILALVGAGAAWAHQPATNNGVTVTLHVDPDDDPVATQPATIVTTTNAK